MCISMGAFLMLLIACFLHIPWYPRETMSQDQLIMLRNKETKEVYYTRKNKRKVERKIELKKYSKKLRKRVTFKEAKK
jgi:large subunit ribosomal protein L33